MKHLIKLIMCNVILSVWLVCVASGQERGTLHIRGYMFGHQPTGQLDTVKAEICVAVKEIKLTDNTKYVYPTKTLIIIDGYVEREKYSYSGDRMPNGLPNNGGAYDDRFTIKRYLDENKNEIKEYVWMAREVATSN